MIVQLPSNGVYGVTQVVLNTPKISHLRTLASSSYTDEQVKTQFVGMLLEDKSILPQMTIYDRDYLFMVAASGVYMNAIQVSYKCPRCEFGGNVAYDISVQEPIFLEAGIPTAVHKAWGGVDYSYHILTVHDEDVIVEYALGDFDEYAKRFEEGVIAVTLGGDASSVEALVRSIEEVKDYPIYVYYSALLFTQMVYHGVIGSVETVCPQCGNPLRVVVPFVQLITNMDTTVLINRFIRLSKFMDFKSFVDLTMPELDYFEKSNASGAIR